MIFHKKINSVKMPRPPSAKLTGSLGKKTRVKNPYVQIEKHPNFATNSESGVDFDYKTTLADLQYEKLKYDLQVELLKMQAWVKETGSKVVIIFEGRDAAGKGSAIKRFMEHLNPRGARIVALEKPTETEKNQWYFQRYTAHLPSAGEIVLFDRSWYNRAGVETVMGFCTPEQRDQFLVDAPQFEKSLVQNGIYLFKFWFSVSKEEQRKRFLERSTHPLKQWKLSPIDQASVDKWDDYTQAKKDMFKATHKDYAPWTIIKADCKKKARLAAIKHVLLKVPYTNKALTKIGREDPSIVQRPDKD